MYQLPKMVAKYFGRSRKEKKTGKEEEIEGCERLSSDLSAEKSVEEKEAEIKNLGKLFVGGLSSSTTTKSLEAYFSRFGKVVDLVIPRFVENGKSKGFAFVTFADPKDAKTVLETEAHVLDGKLVEVRSFDPRETRSKSGERKEKGLVFLGGLPYDISEEVLKQFFSRYGEIVDVSIVCDKITKKSKGYGFLAFKEENAAKKCVADRFIFLSGRRVQMKKADSRNFPKATDSLSTCCASERNFEEDSMVDEEDEVEEEEETQSVTSEKEFLAVEQNLAFKKLFEDYFLEKFATFDKMNGDNLKDEDETSRSQDNDKVTQIGKLLSDLLSSSSDNLGAWGGDLIQFSGESETNSETDSQDDAAGSDMDIMTPKANVCNSSAALDSQKTKPFQIRNKEGDLLCSVCQWISPNDSTESFLAHCRTSAHRAKLKERFSSEQIHDKLEIPSIQNNKQTDVNSLKSKSVSEKHSAAPLEEVKKKGKNMENVEKDKKEKQPQSQAKQLSTAAASVKKKAENKGKASQNSKRKLEAKTEVMKNFKVHALSKGMTLIQPLSEGTLICKMCNKQIPKSDEFEVLMKNVSSHLHSKTHLRKLLETENSLKKLDTTKSTSTTCVEAENRSQNNPRTQGENVSVEKVKKETKAKSIDANKAPAVKKPQNAYKAKNSTPANVPNNPPNKRKPVVTPAGATDKFLCLPCNLICQNSEVFNVHLGLKTHIDNLNRKNIKADDSLANMSKCNNCRIYLLGSMYHINKHYSKCAENKK